MLFLDLAFCDAARMRNVLGAASRAIAATLAPGAALGIVCRFHNSKPLSVRKSIEIEGSKPLTRTSVGGRSERSKGVSLNSRANIDETLISSLINLLISIRETETGWFK